MTASSRRCAGFTPRQAQGFTLIELTLVTLLILMLAGLSAPLFKKTLSDLSAKNASFSICKLINYAQEMAVLERKNYKISFDLKNGRYQLFNLPPSAKIPAYVKAAGRFGKLFSLPRGMKFSGVRDGIVFYPDGHCDEIRINILAGAGGYSIIVKGFGNMVEIKEVKVE
ncbi:MAG: hypothetical protein WC482_00730 [Candidatus Omnitrophota bacterium]